VDVIVDAIGDKGGAVDREVAEVVVVVTVAGAALPVAAVLARAAAARSTLSSPAKLRRALSRSPW
jgi:hypothetical protein